MTTEATIGHGSLVKRGNSATPTEIFTALGEVLSINGLSVTKDTVDVTHMQSPQRWEEIISSIKRTGEISVEMNFVPDGTTTDNCFADVNSNVPRNYQFITPDAAVTWTVMCHATGYEMGIPLDDKMTATLTLKPTGKPGFIV